MIKLPVYLKNLRRYKDTTIFLTPLEMKEITSSQLEVLIYLATLVSPIKVAVTSGKYTPDGNKRTKQNGPNHVSKDAFDVIFTDGKNMLNYPFYSRNLVAWRLCFDLITNFKNKYSLTVVLENNHLHVHFNNDGTPSVILLQDAIPKANGKQGLANREFIYKCCADNSDSIIFKDITDIILKFFQS